MAMSLRPETIQYKHVASASEPFPQSRSVVRAPSALPSLARWLRSLPRLGLRSDGAADEDGGRRRLLRALPAAISDARRARRRLRRRGDGSMVGPRLLPPRA